MDNRKSQARYADDRYAAQRRAGYPWLRFVHDLEAEYRASHIPMNATRIRMAAVIGLAGVVGFVGMDRYLGMHLQSGFSNLLLVGVTAPALLVPVAATFTQRAAPYLLYYLFGGMLLTEFSILAVINIGRTHHPWFPYDALFLVTSYTYFVSGLMFYQAIFCSLSLYVVFVVTNWSLQKHGVLTYEAYYLLVANAIGVLGLYMLEWHARATFLMQNELRQQAVLDSLTGVFNRRAFRSHLESAWLQAQRESMTVGIVLVDIDDFKLINDSCGHPFGDTALQHIAKVFQEATLRPLDAVGRYGGDEFIAMWYGVDPEWFGHLAHGLASQVDGLTCGGGVKPLRVRISGGAVLSHPKAGGTLAEAIAMADRKLYEAKREARGSVLMAPIEKKEEVASG